jgi:uncharacterized repeat protein (TIGR01451 family)
MEQGGKMADTRRRVLARSRGGWFLAAVAGSLALFSALRAGAQEAPVPGPNIFHRPETQRRIARDPGNLVFHGGAVMTSFTAYLIFWLPPGVHFSSSVSDANYEQLVTRYFQDVGASPFYNIVTQYPGNNGTPLNAVTFGGSIVDTDPYPRAGTIADPLLDIDVRQEIGNVITAQSWPTGIGTMYFLFTGSGIQSCFDPAHNICSQSDYCAYHSAFSFASQPVIYANMPDGYSFGDCGFADVNGDPAADVVISTVSHEHFEAVTDPVFNAWYENNLNGEIGDKCAYDYGPGGDSTTPNVFLNGHPYRLQREWSNALGACALSLCGTSVCPPAVTVANTVTPCVAGTAGDTIDYTVDYDNASDVDMATYVSITETLPAGVQWASGTPPSSIIGNVLTFFVPDINVRGGGTIQFSTTLTSPPAPFTLLPSTAALDFSDSLAHPAPAVTSSATTAVPCGAWCGNQVVDAGEQCDEGPANGGCCSATCQYEPNGSPCASDGLPCTSDVCDGVGSCTHAATAAQSCRTAEKSTFLLQSTNDGTKDKLVWKWLKGASTTQTEFGNPTSTADYTLCIYAGTTSSLLDQITIPADMSKWIAISKGYKYSDPTPVGGGVTRVLLKGSDQNKSKALVKGKGAGLPDLSLPLAAPLTVQLVNGDNGLCWSASYTTAQLLSNDTGLLKAKAP